MLPPTSVISNPNISSLTKLLTPDERLFPVTKSYLSHEMIRGCKNTSVKKIRIHDIRHSHASLLINQGCDALMLEDRLGHKKISTTLNTYSHLFPHKQQELVHSLESLQARDLPTLNHHLIILCLKPQVSHVKCHRTMF